MQLIPININDENVYFDTEDIKKSKFKVRKYNYYNGYCEPYYCIYVRTKSGAYGNHMETYADKPPHYKTIKECEKAIENYLKEKEALKC